MDELVKEVLKSNKTLLVKNIISCEEFFAKLTQLGVFPDSMVQEIRECSSQEEKNGRMVDLLSLRGLATAHKFCDALQMSGHSFLADFIRDELMASPSQGTTPRANDGGSLARKFPKVDKIIQDNRIYVDKEELAAYLTDKIQEEVVKHSWRLDMKEKEKAMDAKQRQLEEAWKYKEVIEQKTRVVNQLEDVLEKIREEVAERDAEIRRIKRGTEDLKDKHIKSMDSQIQFNLANDKSLRRLTEREIEINTRLQELNNQMDEHLQRIKPSKSFVRRESVDMSTDVTPIMATRTKLAEVLQVLGTLGNIKEKYDGLKEEHGLMLIHLGVEKAQEDSTSLLDAFRAFVVENEHQISNLKEQIKALEKSAKEREGLPDAQGVKDLQKSLEDTRSELMSKDMIVNKLESDIRKLKVIMALKDARKQKVEPLPRPNTPSLPISQLSSARSMKSHQDELRSIPSRRSAKIETLVLDTSNTMAVPKPKSSKAVATFSDTSKLSSHNAQTHSLNLPPLRKSKGAVNQSWSHAPTSSIPAKGHGAKQTLGKGMMINAPATRITREPTVFATGLDQLSFTGVSGQKSQSYGARSKHPKQIHGNFQGPYQKQQSFELQRAHTMYQQR